MDSCEILLLVSSVSVPRRDCETSPYILISYKTHDSHMHIDCVALRSRGEIAFNIQVISFIFQKLTLNYIMHNKLLYKLECEKLVRVYDLSFRLGFSVLCNQWKF